MSRIITVNNINRLWQNGILPISRRVDDLEANGCGNVVYLTQAEYDELPDTKLTDDVEYRITDAGVRGSAENVSYDNSVSGLDAKNMQEAVDKLNDSLTNENHESFNFGIKDGVRGFYTDPSRADDSFIPFKSAKSIADMPTESYSGYSTNKTLISFTPECPLDKIQMIRINGSFIDGSGETVEAYGVYTVKNGDINETLINYHTQCQIIDGAIQYGQTRSTRSGEIYCTVYFDNFISVDSDENEEDNFIFGIYQASKNTQPLTIETPSKPKKIIIGHMDATHNENGAYCIYDVDNQLSIYRNASLEITDNYFTFTPAYTTIVDYAVYYSL